MTYQTALGSLADAVEARVAAWDDTDARQRLWAKDHTLWTAEPRPEIEDRLGWLRLPDTMRPHLSGIEALVADVRTAGFTHVVLLGMGGSSLAPDVFAATFGTAAGYPSLQVLDSTHPAAVAATTAAIDPDRTLFVVSSKSGTTVEPLSLLAHFWSVVAETSERPGDHFVAITDPGTGLAERARSDEFRAVFETIPDVGGRYSALTHFGLVPAALIGVDIGDLLDRAAAVDVDDAFHLGAVLGEAALAGRDKATWLVSDTFRAFPAWVEQLVAESTGKSGTGILPVADEAVGAPTVYGADRVFVSVSVAGDDDVAHRAAVELLEFAGHPVVRITVDDPTDLAGEMYRAEIAVAMAGSVLGIHPFDQPDVQLAKQLAQQAIDGTLDAGEIPEAVPGTADFAETVRAFVDEAGDRAFVALQAFIEPTQAATERLQRARHLVRDRKRVATTLGFGPRFLHSTGQYHKGGPNTGRFIQIVDHPAPELPVPGTDLTFSRLVSGQADGDHQALTEVGRHVLRICLGDDIDGGLDALVEAVS